MVWLRFHRLAHHGSLWRIATKPYSGAHFATFPPDLIEPCILAGTSPQACEACGSPWERVVEREAQNHISRQDRQTATGGAITGGVGKNFPDVKLTQRGWQPTCTCDNKGDAPCTILDPFGGSGTVTMMSEMHQRNSIYIDINREYVDLAKQRCGFTEKMIDTATWEVIAVRSE